MTNLSGGNILPGPFGKGQILSASDLNKIVDAVAKRIVGSGISRVRAAGGNAVVSTEQINLIRAPNTILVELVEEISPAVYSWTLYQGSGPLESAEDEGAVELNGTEGLEPGTRCILRRANGVWYFTAGGGASPETVYRVETVMDDVLLCATVDETWEPDSSGVVSIMRPIDLKRSTFDGLTIAGVDYTSTGVQSRTGDDGSDTEDHIILPPYVEGVSLIVVGTLTNGYGAIVDGSAYEPVGYDKNNSGRAWGILAV